MLQAGSARKGLSAFFLAGLISAFLGAILPAWRHHIQPDYLLIAAYFLLQNLGMLLGPLVSAPLLRSRGLGVVLAAGAGLAACGFLLLAFFQPPAAVWWRLGALLLTGLGAGILQIGVFHGVGRAYEMHPAATLNLGGALFGLGCLTSSLLVASTLFQWQVLWILVGLAVIPGVYAVLYLRSSFPQHAIPEQADIQAVTADFKNPSAILFALLLFFQFGNEGALAGWLALFLTQRLGMSPATALSLLATYWLALILGRIAAQWLLPRIHHGRLLLASVFVPMFACLILTLTNNFFGAITGVLLAGGGFAIILPLVVEKIGYRFPYFHPVLFNGIFTIALSGALLAPASLGVLAHYFGIGVVMGLPLLGSVMVLLLLGLILLEAKLSGGPGPAAG
jgi:fucose permease